jgi:hypothetical protein
MARLVGILVGVLAIFALGVIRWSPGPVGSESGAGAFGVGRAREVLAEVVGDGAPRVPGSEALERARRVAERRLSEAGFRTERQRGFTCSAMALCGFVENVVALRAGSDALGPVLVMAHLDSVQAGPGAGDDGLGVAAVVEAARAIGAGAPLARPVLVVLTDGEESGLLGATLFAEAHPLAREVAAVVNVDARGSGGPSLLFEVSGGARVVRLAASHLPRPLTSSLFAEIYRRMPNDTDFTLFRGRVPGVNFANVAGVARYHTSRDALDGIEPGTLRHHGEQVLAMARAFAAERAPAAPEPDVIWFDVLALGVVRVPAVFALPLAALALGLVLAAFRREASLRARVARAARAFGALLAALAAATATGLALRALGALPAPWVAHPGPALAAFHLVALAALLALVPRDHGSAWTALASLGVLLAFVAPGASHLFVAPALVAGLLGLVLGPSRAPLAAAVAALVLALLWLPLSVPLYETVGLLAPADVLPVSVVALALAQLLPKAVPARGVASVAAGLALVALAAGLSVPRFTADHPQRVNVLVRQDEGGPAWVAASAAWGPRPWGPVPAPMAAARGAPEREAVMIPGWSAVAARAVPRLALPPPEVTRAPGDPSSLRVRSVRGARVLFFETSAPLAVEGRVVVPVEGRVVVRGVPDAGLRVRAPGDLVVADVTPGVEASPLGETIVRARPPEAVPSQDGDITIVSTRPPR